jgi:hypothetical protein
LKNERWKVVVAVSLWLGGSVLIAAVQAAETSDVREHAERTFDRLAQQTEQRTSHKSAGGPAPAGEFSRDGYSSGLYWIGQGQGNLSKGAVVCQRVSELSARTDLAKQIRVLVKEHMVDRVRERSGREPEQDIELTREEIVQEYLQGVKIVNRQIDEEGKTCSATAVMLKTLIQSKPAADGDASPLSAK